MGDIKVVVGGLCILAGLLTTFSDPARGAVRWPQFRGEGGSGIATEGEKPPVEFGASKNLLWKTPVPKGHSCPCIWDDRVFLTGFDKGKLETLCVSRTDGKVLWRRAAPAQKIERFTPMNSPATPTPTTDGQRVYVFFGSFGVIAYDFAGKEIWQKPLAVTDARHGSAASPVLAAGKLIINGDQENGKSFLAALDPQTGQTIWQVPRPLYFTSHTTPVHFRRTDADEIVLAGSVRLAGHDLKDGSERWSCRGLEAVSICPSPVIADDTVFAMSYSMTEKLPKFDDALAKFDKDNDEKLVYKETTGVVKDVFTIIDSNSDGIITRQEWDDNYRVFKDAENGLFALKNPGKGDVTATHIAWKDKKTMATIGSPLYYRGRIYTIRDGGLLSCLDASTGKPFYVTKRIGADGQYYASPIAANGKVYLSSMLGMVSVAEAGDDLKVLANNDLGEAIAATPAVAGNCLYVRTAEHLWAFGE